MGAWGHSGAPLLAACLLASPLAKFSSKSKNPTPVRCNHQDPRSHSLFFTVAQFFYTVYRPREQVCDCFACKYSMNIRAQRWFSILYRPHYRLDREEWLYIALLAVSWILAWGFGLALGFLWLAVL